MGCLGWIIRMFLQALLLRWIDKIVRRLVK
jgi:hypothetical protein